MDTDLERLQEMGFVRVGRWQLDRGELQLRLHGYGEHCPALYAFVNGTSVLYVGKTLYPLAQRLSQHRRPGRTQLTHQKTHRNLKQLLKLGAEVEIWALAGAGLASRRVVSPRAAAELRNRVVAQLAPPWNGREQHTPSPVQSGGGRR